MSKQAAGQLVDTLVLRGYLDRSPDPEDRRRMTVTLTERGAMAASACPVGGRRSGRRAGGRGSGADRVTATRATLAALIEIGRESATPTTTAERPIGSASRPRRPDRSCLAAHPYCPSPTRRSPDPP